MATPVENNEVVAAAMHFDKRDFHPARYSDPLPDYAMFNPRQSARARLRLTQPQTLPAVSTGQRRIAQRSLASLNAIV